LSSNPDVGVRKLTPTYRLNGRFGGPEALAAIEGHVLDSARVTGTYVINPRLG
jgi:hypothetical protein